MILPTGRLSFEDLQALAVPGCRIELGANDWAAIRRARAQVDACVEHDEATYGVNTGFGLLATTKIARADIETLQENLLLSHAAGVGKALPDHVVRLALALKVNALAQGFSGVRPQVIERLLALYNRNLLPIVPSQGSVGASGDLAPLAHLCLPLIGQGELRSAGPTISAQEGLARCEQAPLKLAAKEGLALINGTQISTAIAIVAAIKAFKLFDCALVGGAMSVDGLKGSHRPFAADVADIRGQPGQIEVAGRLRALLDGSQIGSSHADCGKVQDPYSFRCQPQVIGAALDLLNFARDVLVREANAVTDNPLVFAQHSEIISGGNFHAQPVAHAADVMALAIAELGSISERRVAVMVDPKLSDLPAFLVEDSGLNSGFMIAQVTAAALVAENKALAAPCSIDSIPTSAGQEDHVSMATHAALRLLRMTANLERIIAIEWLAAAQAIDFRRPLKSSAILERVHQQLRAEVPFIKADRIMSTAIEEARRVMHTASVA